MLANPFLGSQRHIAVAQYVEYTTLAIALHNLHGEGGKVEMIHGPFRKKWVIRFEVTPTFIIFANAKLVKAKSIAK